MTKTANIHNEPPGPRARLPKLIVGCVRLRLVRPYLGCCQAQVPRCAFFTSLTLPRATPNSPNDSVAVVRLLAVRRPVLPSPSLPLPPRSLHQESPLPAIVRISGVTPGGCAAARRGGNSHFIYLAGVEGLREIVLHCASRTLTNYFFLTPPQLPWRAGA